MPALVEPTSMSCISSIRNLAIIAHIDHGKTTLIDSILRAGKVFRDSARVEERVMDNNELERERGITIRAKHCTVEWEGHIINIIDTPGHADFSGEVERVLSMVDSVLLLVDANEGPMPQTRYVLMRALRRGLRPIVIVNKVDRPQAFPQKALHDTFDLFIELGANDHQIDFPVLYGSGQDGWMVRDLDDPRDGMRPLFECILKNVPAPTGDLDAPFQMQISTLAWSDYLGRIGGGRVLQGRYHVGEPLLRTTMRWKSLMREHDGCDEWEVLGTTTERTTDIFVTRGLERIPVEEISAGDIVWIAGPQDITIGDAFSAPDHETPSLPPLEIEEPTVAMFFLVNSGPLSGNEGRAITIRQIKERLEREMRVNVSLRMEDLGRSDGVKVSGRGELHLAILIEEMRREGLELCVSRPEVITRVEPSTGETFEPVERLVIDVPEDYQGVVIEKISRRKGEIKNVHNAGTGMIRLEFEIPTRGLIGYRNEFLTDTRGLGILASRFVGYCSWRGEIPARNRGSMVSLDTGNASSYSLENLQTRGTLFVRPMDPIYEGMIVGENARPEDLPCNPTKRKALTNHRASTREVEVGLKVPRTLSLDTALEWIGEDELVEATPKSIRVRKAILDFEDRKRSEKRFSDLSEKGA